MDTSLIDSLRNCASNFRRAIEEIGGETLGSRFGNFPHGACGDTSYVLGAYLSECGFGEFDYVCGEKDNASHAWLESDGIIVDITADQFAGGDRIYVGTYNDFYRQFPVSFRHLWFASLEGNSIETDRLYPQYKRIKAKVNEYGE